MQYAWHRMLSAMGMNDADILNRLSHPALG